MKINEPHASLTAVMLVATALAAGAADLMTCRWDELARRGVPLCGRIREGAGPEGQAALELTSTNPAGSRFALLTITNPPVTRAVYALAGQIRYQDVEGRGYLEMWSRIPGRGDFFSRTLAARGPLASLQGSSDWRPFVLPFNRANAAPPTALYLNLVLPGRGRVWISDIRLRESDNFGALVGAWWSDRTGGVIGAAAGSLIGVLGATVGILVARARARRLVFAIVYLMFAGGILSLVTGLVALVLQQPYAVFYPPLLAGGICVFVIGVTFTGIKRRYQRYELQRMQSLDAP